MIAEVCLVSVAVDAGYLTKVVVAVVAVAAVVVENVQVAVEQPVADSAYLLAVVDVECFDAAADVEYIAADVEYTDA